MAVFRVEKNKNYTVMSNVHLRDRNLSLKAKGLLAMILSLPEGWRYSIEGLAAISRESRASINSGLKELEKNGYLTRRQLRDEKGRLTNTEYTIYEEPRSPCVDFPSTDNPSSDNPSSGGPSAENSTEISKEEPITEKENKEISNYRFNSVCYDRDRSQDAVEKRRRERNEYSDLIKKNIGYDVLIRNNSLRENEIREIFEIMLDTVCSGKSFIRIGGDDKPADVVRSQLLKLDSGHIEYVLECMKKNTSKVLNIRQYLLTSLYNAPQTISNYYTSQVGYDEYEESYQKYADMCLL